MVKIYVMDTCPDCTAVKAAAQGNPEFEVIDIGKHVRSLKEFLRLRDTHPKFSAARERGLVGIPSFLLPDGTVTFNPVRAGLKVAPVPETQAPAHPEGSACNIDGTGC